MKKYRYNNFFVNATKAKTGAAEKKVTLSALPELQFTFGIFLTHFSVLNFNPPHVTAMSLTAMFYAGPVLVQSTGTRILVSCTGTVFS